MREPTRVLHVLGSLERGGVESWLLELLPRLDRSEWQFDFCTLGPDPGRYAPLARSWGSRVLVCPLRADDCGTWSFPLRLHRILRAGRYGVVHSNVHHFSGFVLAVAAAAGVRVRVAHSHNTHDGRSNTFSRDLYRRSAAWLLRRSRTLGLACAASAADALFGRLWRDNPRVVVVHYGIEPNSEGGEAADGSAARRQLGIPPGVPVVGHVGRFERQKNHDFLLDLAATLKARRPDLRWLLVGDGERRREIESKARRLRLADRVVLCGRREDVHDLMAGAMDAFVLPSLHEGLPLVLLEAQAAGLRSLASSRITSEAAVVEGAVEFLPLEAGPRTWAPRLLACLEAGRIPLPWARQRIQAAGFGIDQSLGRLIEAYRSAAGNVRPGPE